MQDKQIIITIGREYGSLGHLIAEKVGEELELPVLDRDFFRQMSINHGVDPKFVREHDEKKRNLFITRQRRGYSNSMEDIVAEMVFDYERELAETGESLIIVGRCAEWVLRDFPNLIRIFITADDDTKAQRIAEMENVDLEEAAKIVKKKDKKRGAYHEYYTGLKWGVANEYDLCVNSSEIGVEGVAKLILQYVEDWKEVHSTEECE